MAKPEFLCENGCQSTGLKDWFDAVRSWDEGLKCECGGKVNWFGVWPPPKALPLRRPEHYEVVHVITFDGGFAELDWYKPVVLICQPRESSKLVIWPRYWITPGGRPKFGQDGPHMRPEGLTFVHREVQKFIARYRTGRR